MEFFNSTFENYKRLFGVNDFEFVVHDKHPDYGSTKFARQFDGSNSMLIKVQHHKAHIASVIAENNLKCDLLGFAWDGTGYGDDGKVWGSEIFKVDRNLEFTRTGHLMEKFLPGGSITIEKPYRMCLVYLNYLWKKNMKDKESFRDFVYRIQPAYKDIIEDMEIKAIEGQVKSGFNSPVTTSMGRLFDAVSSLLGLTHISSFEGAAAIHLEMAMEDKNINEFLKNDTRNIENKYRYDTGMKNKKGYFIINDFYIFSQILEDLGNGNKKSEISFKFHNTLAQIILDTSIYFRLNKGIETIVLSGGVFQNNYLTEICFKLLEINNFKVYSNFKVPVNDGGISLGQAYMAAFKKNIK